MAAPNLTFPKAIVLAPLTGYPLLAVITAVWTVGAFYCHGYERMTSGAGEWPGAYMWSSFSVMPWLVLFEWSKRPHGRRVTQLPGGLALALIMTASLSLGLAAGAEYLTGTEPTPLALALLRRFPPIAASLILILWARAERNRSEPLTDDVSGSSIATLAASIDWIEAADNYVELHIGDRVLIRRMTMAAAERSLDRHGFVRIHRRYLVNRARIERIAGSNGGRTVTIGTAQLPVGTRYAARLKY